MKCFLLVSEVFAFTCNLSWPLRVGENTGKACQFPWAIASRREKELFFALHPEVRVGWHFFTTLFFAEQTQPVDDSQYVHVTNLTPPGSGSGNPTARASTSARARRTCSSPSRARTPKATPSESLRRRGKLFTRRTSPASAKRYGGAVQVECSVTTT
jgi:hypothetical protein